jgi:hypothetical protein
MQYFIGLRKKTKPARIFILAGFATFIISQRDAFGT